MQMRFFVAPSLVASLVLSGCLDFQQTLEVRITPNLYQVGAVKSELATPVVDEVVRIGPPRVVMLMCRNTPHARVIQFERELSARHKTKLQGTLTDGGCPV